MSRQNFFRNVNFVYVVIVLFLSRRFTIYNLQYEIDSSAKLGLVKVEIYQIEFSPMWKLNFGMA